MPLDAARRSHVAVTVTFAAHAVIAGSLGPWIPRLKADAGLDASELGLALTAFAIGLVAGTRLAGPALRRFGGRRVVRIGIPALAAAFALLPAANDLIALSGAFCLLGLAAGLLDVAMNTEAVAVERRSGRRLMSGIHAAWSASMLAGAALAAAGIGAGIPIAVHLPVLAAVLVVTSFPLLRWLPAPHEALHEAPIDGSSDDDRSNAVRVAMLCLIGFVAFQTEGIAAEWSAVYLHESVGTTLGVAGLGVVAFSAGMAASRFGGDRLSTRFDPSAVVRVGTFVGAIALASALIAGSPIVSIAALAILGLGVGPTVPLAFSATGALGGERGRRALGLVLTSGYVGSIVGPIVVGFTADRIGFRWAFTIPVALCVVAAIAASALTASKRLPGARRSLTGPARSG